MYKALIRMILLTNLLSISVSAESISIMIEKYCFKCHSNKKTKGRPYILEAISPNPSKLESFSTWRPSSLVLSSKELSPQRRRHPEHKLELINRTTFKFHLPVYQLVLLGKNLQASLRKSQRSTNHSIKIIGASRLNIFNKK